MYPTTFKQSIMYCQWSLDERNKRNSSNLLWISKAHPKFDDFRSSGENTFQLDFQLLLYSCVFEKFLSAEQCNIVSLINRESLQMGGDEG